MKISDSVIKRQLKNRARSRNDRWHRPDNGPSGHREQQTGIFDCSKKRAYEETRNNPAHSQCFAAPTALRLQRRTMTTDLFGDETFCSLKRTATAQKAFCTTGISAVKHTLVIGSGNNCRSSLDCVQMSVRSVIILSPTRVSAKFDGKSC